MYKKPSQATGNGVYTKEIIEMMDKTQQCLNCGRPLRYQPHDNRGHRGYCSAKCLYAKPPKMAYIENIYKKPIRQLILDEMNRCDNLTAVAGLLGVERQTLAEYLKKLKIKRIVKYVG